MTCCCRGKEQDREAAVLLSVLAVAGDPLRMRGGESGLGLCFTFAHKDGEHSSHEMVTPTEKGLCVQVSQSQ